MKKLIIFTCFIVFTNFLSLKSQNSPFAPVGAKWYYTTYDMILPVITYVTLTCTKDTVILGMDAREISGNYFYESNQQVFHYNPQLNCFNLLYDFNKNAGETWEIITTGITDTITIMVDSVGTMVLNSDTLKVQYISSQNMLWDFYGKTIENIGNTNYMFPQYGLADPHVGPLRCYEDSNYFYQAQPIPCDTTWIVNNHEINNMSDVLIYPNPAKDFFKIVNYKPVNHYNYSLFNQTGAMIDNKMNINESEFTVDSKKLSKGVYFIKLIFDKTVLTRKLLVQ